MKTAAPILCALAGFFSGPDAQATDAPLAVQAQAILKAHCHRCHGKDGTDKGGLNYILDPAKLAARNKVVPGKPAASELYQRVLAGEMPPADQKLRPGREDMQVLEQWIAAGAPGVEARLPRPLLAQTDIDGLILADLQALEPRQRRFTRYLSFAHLASVGDKEMRISRLALAKLLNSLSWQPRLAVPQAIDPAATIYRIDLRELKWNARLWDRVVAAYPYSFGSSSATRSIATLTGSELACVRADWFVATAARPPLYHDLLQLPGSARQLERQLQVDVLTNIQEESVVRAGFSDSGVSRNNRLIERHDAGYGAYWRSYDFADNLDRQNLFNHPLGPAPTGPDAFVHAGGEIIFHLPNGLQAYLLVDSNGQRIDQAPVEIVSDPRRSDRKVENGLSCMSCHVRGVIFKADQVRAHVLKNLQAFARADAETVKALYPPAQKMKDLVKQDSKRFEKALADLGIAAEQDEPITLVVQRFEGTVDLPGAAAEVGLTHAELALRLERSQALMRVLGPLRVKGGVVQRQAFEAAFAELVKEPNAGAPAVPLPGGDKGAFAGHQGAILSIAFAANGRLAVSGSADRTVRLWDVTSGRELRSFEGHASEVTAVAISADGRQLVSGGGDRLIRLWDGGTGRALRRFEGHTDGILALAFSTDGAWIVSASRDGTVRLWDAAKGTEVRSLAGHTGPVSALALSADGRRILSGSHDRTVRLWDATTGRELSRLEGHGREVHAVALSADGRRAVSGGNDLAVRLWNLETGKELRRFEGHANAVIRLAFAADGKQVLSASSQYQTVDRTLRLWDVETGQLVSSFGGAAADRIGCVAFSPDGSAALSGSSEVTLRFWKLTR